MTFTARPFRFACQAYSATSAGQWRDLARRVEANGYSALQVADHYIGPGPKLDPTNHPVQELAAIPAVAMAAEATGSLRIGCRMLCIDYHQPVVLAKQAATLQMLSEGRFELGLGAGWLRAEYEAMGIPFRPAGERIAKLAETLELVRQFFAGGEVDVAGEHVHAEGFAARPVVDPPPIMVGGGARRVLGLAGAKADIVSINFDNSSGMIGPAGFASSTEEKTREKIEWVRAGAGPRFGDIELETAAYFVAVEGGSGPSADRLSAVTGMTLDELRAFPHALVGSVDAICEELDRRRAEFGFSYVTVGDAVAEDFAPVVARLAGK
jgi:probable F420-dependent oxidoreductase